MQAARGTSLSHSARDADRPGRSRGLLVLFVLSAAVLYAADQVTKALVVAHLTQGGPNKPLIGTFLQLSLTRNPGAAFSTGTSYTVVLSLLAIVAVVVVVAIAWRANTRIWALALGILLAGIAGNLTDRLVRDPSPLHGHVVDFLRLPHWPIFNVADMCINVAAALILIQAFRGVKLSGARVGDDRQAAGSDADSDSPAAVSDQRDPES